MVEWRTEGCSDKANILCTFKENKLNNIELLLHKFALWTLEWKIKAKDWNIYGIKFFQFLRYTGVINHSHFYPFLQQNKNLMAYEIAIKSHREAALNYIIESNIEDQDYKNTWLKKDIYCKIEKSHSLD